MNLPSSAGEPPIPMFEACRARPIAAWTRLPGLFAALAGEDASLQEQAVDALENAGEPSAEDAAATAPLLENVLEALPHDDARYWAATLLGRCGASAAGSAPALAAALRGDACLAVRERAAWALGRLGPAAGGADVEAALEAAAAGGPARLAKLAREALSMHR